MVNVGLPRVEERTATTVDRTLLVSLGLLLVSGAAYVAVSVYRNSLESSIVEANAATQSLKDQLKSEQSRQVADFARRTEEIDSHLGSMFIPSDTLSDLEASVLPEVTVKSFKYDSDGEKVKIDAVTGVIKDVARQMVAFKDSGRFSDVSAGMVGLTEDGGIQFSISMERKVAAAGGDMNGSGSEDQMSQ